MKNLRRLIGSTQFHAFLAFILLCLFSWPLLTIPDTAGGLSPLIYLVVSWIILILVFACFDIQRGKGDDD